MRTQNRQMKSVMDVEDSTLTEQQYADMKVGLSALWATATDACQPCPQAAEALFWSSTLVDAGGREACNVYSGRVAKTPMTAIMPMQSAWSAASHNVTL